MFTPREIYEAWPDNGLLGIGPPHEDETAEEYIVRAKYEAGDLLFAFVLAECTGEDASEPGEAMRRLSNAVRDLCHVTASLWWVRDANNHQM